MAYPTDSLEKALRQLDQTMIALQGQATRAVTRLQSGPTAATPIIDLAITLTRDKAALATLAATPGLANYAKDIKNDQALDIVAEYQVVITALDAVVAWITTNFPVDGDGYLLRETWGANGPEDRTFTTAATVGLVSALQVLAASID